MHYIPLEYFTTFFRTTIVLLSNYMYYFGNRKRLLHHIQTKKYFWIVTARVFFQRFYYLIIFFFLNSLEQRDTDSLIATIPLWYSLSGVARYVLLVGWSCWLHSTRWMYHRTVPMVDAPSQLTLFAKKTGLPAVNACPSSIFMRVRVVRVPDFSI